jgi:hypothetical protein
MNGTIARRVALALSAFAFVVSVVSLPSSVAAAPANDGQPPAKETPTLLYPPNMQVTSLGMVHHASTPDGYLFRVKNIGQGPAIKVDTYKTTKIYRRYDHAFIKTDSFKFTHPSPVNAGEEFLVEVSCNARGPEYCDFGSLGVVVSQGLQDSDVSNNYAIDNDDSNGKPSL